MNKKVIVIASVILFLLFLYILGQQLINSLQAGYRLDQEMAKLANLQQQNQQLRSRLKEIQSPQFIEQQARDKLNLGRSGETMVIIPQDKIDQILGLSKKVEEIKIPNWQGWLKLFTR